MVQNPHHYPWRHAPSLVQGSPAGTDKRQKGVAGNDGGVTGGQLRDGACAR